MDSEFGDYHLVNVVASCDVRKRSAPHDRLGAGAHFAARRHFDLGDTFERDFATHDGHRPQ